MSGHLRIHSLLRTLLFGAVLLALSACGVFAQELGSIVGTVTDPSGGAVPAVAITVTNQRTGLVARTTITNADGNYEVPDLPPSVYSVKAEKTGFQSLLHSEINVEVHSS